MEANVKHRRSYRSHRRALTAAQTRQSILDAGRLLFLRDGWVKTTIAAIAREAGVSSETIYAVFGTKRAVLKELISLALRGGAPETPLLEQAGPQEIKSEKNQRRQLELFARDIAAILNRIAPLVAVVRAAAETETEMAALYRELHAGRRRNLAFMADALLANGPVRDGLDREQVISCFWRLASPELFVLIRDVEGVTPERYQAWLRESLTRQLL